MGRLNNTTSGGRLKSAKIDLNSSEGLTELAIDKGLEDEVTRILDKTPKLSTLQRLGKGLGAFNPAEAILTGTEKGAVAGVGKYVSGVVKGVGSAVTGTDYEGERRTFADVAEKLGVENSIAKFGIGVVGDILLDPSTYLGGAIAKGIVKGTQLVAGTTLKGVGKVAPDVEKGLRLAGQGVKDATGKAFVYGYGTSKGVANKALEIQSEVSKAKEGIVASNLARLGTGTLSPSQQEELVEKLLAGKRAEFGARGTSQEVVDGKKLAREVAQSTDPLVQQTIGEQATRSQKFAKQAGIQDPFEIYFPGLKNDKIASFLESSRGLRVGSQSYKKEFKNILGDDEMIRNPAEAFAKREFEIAKDNIIKSQLKNIIGDVGVPLAKFATEDEALKNGFRLIKEKGVFGKPLGYLREVDHKFLSSLITPEFASIDAIARATGFDSITSLFKRSVTGLFAPFHVRNFASGMIQNFEVLGKDALNPLNISMGQKLAWKVARGHKFANEKINIGGKSVNLGKAMNAFSRRFGGSSQYYSDIADATRGAGNLPGEILSKGSFKETAKTFGLGQNSIHFRAARAVGNYIETQQKATAFITALGQGKTVEQALELAVRAGFDYRALTGFESKVLRRLIPFYSFARKNVELQLRVLGENPQRINQVMSTLSNASNMTKEEIDKLPDYAKEQFSFKVGENVEGLPEIAIGAGTPVEAFALLFGVSKGEQSSLSDTIRKTASMLNPLFKAPLERAFNKDFFRDRPLDEVIEATEYVKAPQFVKDFLKAKPIKKKNKDGTTRITYNADPRRLHLMRNLPTSRAASYISALFSDVSLESKILNAATGVKPRPIDLETVEYFRNRDNMRDLENLLIRAGVLKKFEKTYIPKN